MSEAYCELVARVHAWFERSRAAGWVDDALLARLTRVDRATPADLFELRAERPLVVAFFGGTGVGKSSLLNRLAEAPIARVGVERPTSHEVTLYVHNSVQLAKLPEELPLEDVRIERHDSAPHRDVVWIDAPDIDSTTETNRRSALAWLPHIDLVIYVVSPERYRDDAGWRVVLARGARHGWIFVMNHWDTGDARQRDDFGRMLRGAGFEDPLLLVTSCLPGEPELPSADQFRRLRECIRSLLEAHGVEELERLGHRARLLELRAVLNAARERLGDDRAWAATAEAWNRQWRAARETLLEGASWSMQTAAGRLAARENAGVLPVRRRLLKAVSRQVLAGPEEGAASAPADPRAPGREPPGLPAAHEIQFLTESLWDAWADAKLESCLDAVEVEIRRLGLGADLIRAELASAAGAARTRVLDGVQDCVRARLARLEGRARTVGRRISGFLMTVLPTLALLWVGVEIVRGYARAARGQAAFLGVEFAVHSILLVVIAWAVPFAIDRLLRPSLAKLALLGMRAGFIAGLDAVDREMSNALTRAATAARGFRDEAKLLVDETSAMALKPVRTRDEVLARVIISKPREAVSG